ncbi:hypothetical protein SAY87_001111 [Trapa incisa]|uniref:SOSEKI DIX-like domain-containing protein n=1 Tax=Trapa incisa TaxID=236973 RepID=A0AAN7JHE4_9MYRT|nr:hypothetical protein SAY87_001111 [Trapa incisa]
MSTSNSRHRGGDACNPRKYKSTSPERTKLWMEPPKLKHNYKHVMDQRRVAVVYYLSLNGLLEHPHFIEVPLSSPEGLYLRDVINRLNHLRGQGMADMYAWSSKRIYKSGYVWQDLSENDFIQPCQGQEYILKGSRLLERSVSDLEHLRFSNLLRQSKNRPSMGSSSCDDINFTSAGAYSARTTISNASTQTEKHGQETTMAVRPPEEVEELSGEEISPPPVSNNSSGELARESYEIGSDPRDRQDLNDQPAAADIRNQLGESERPSGRIRASAVLMQLIKCGFKNAEEMVSLPRRG